MFEQIHLNQTSNQIIYQLSNHKYFQLIVYCNVFHINIEFYIQSDFGLLKMEHLYQYHYQLMKLVD
jgi:hypothetical protein